MPSARPTLYGSRHAVSAGHYLATAAGFSILESGGNAIVDAIHAHTGVKHIDMPVTPASLWAVIEAHRTKKAA